MKIILTLMKEFQNIIKEIQLLMELDMTYQLGVIYII